MISDETQSRTLGELARAVGGVVHGDPALELRGVAGLAEAGPGHIAFFNNPRYRDSLKATRASAVIVRADAVDALEGHAGLVVDDPYLSFAKVSAIFHPRPSFEPGIDPRAVVEEGAQVDPTATVMAFAFVARGAMIGPHVALFPGVFVGEESVVGAGSVLYPNVVVRERCTIGERAIVHPGVVLGADGFGFAFDKSRPEHFKIPQVGTVEVGDDVEIGSNSAIDRAALGVTRIGAGTKIDNLVQIGHNVQVGDLSILCGQVGLAGSCTLGKGVICAGQVGVGNHLKIADGVKIGPKAGVMSDVFEPGDYLGVPLMKTREAMRAYVAFAQGAETMKTVKRLEKRLEELEQKLAQLEK